MLSNFKRKCNGNVFNGNGKQENTIPTVSRNSFYIKSEYTTLIIKFLKVSFFSET